jgi:hypothetical protein
MLASGLSSFHDLYAIRTKGCPFVVVVFAAASVL